MEKDLQKLKKNLRLLGIGAAAMELFQVDTLPFLLTYFHLKTLTFESVSTSSYNILGYQYFEMEGRKLDDFVCYEKELKEGKRIVQNNLDHIDMEYTATNHYKHQDGQHAIKFEWFFHNVNGGENTFCIGVPVDKVKINQNH